MAKSLTRRRFTTAAAAIAASGALARGAAVNPKPVRVGFVGVGGRGAGMLRYSLGIKGARVPAVCDISAARADKAAKMAARAGQTRPETYTKGPEDFRRMMDRDDLDAVYIATPWEWHAPMAVYAMKRKQYVGVEMPCAITLDECRQLVKTSEATGVPCMMMENCRRFLMPNQIKMADLARSFGIHIMYHTDGAARGFLPDLIDQVGIEILNPIQWRCPGMDREGLVRDFGDRVIFHGSIDNQQTLAFGSVYDVIAEVRESIEIYRPARWICAPCHNIQPISPTENIVAMYEAIHERGGC